VNKPNPSLKQHAKNTVCVNDFWQQVAMFVFKCQQSTLFSSIYATDRHKEADSSGTVQNLQLRFGSPLRDPFS